MNDQHIRGPSPSGRRAGSPQKDGSMEDLAIEGGGAMCFYLDHNDGLVREVDTLIFGRQFAKYEHLRSLLLVRERLTNLTCLRVLKR